MEKETVKRRSSSAQLVIVLLAGIVISFWIPLFVVIHVLHVPVIVGLVSIGPFAPIMLALMRLGFGLSEDAERGVRIVKVRDVFADLIKVVLLLLLLAQLFLLEIVWIKMSGKLEGGIVFWLLEFGTAWLIYQRLLKIVRNMGLWRK